MTKKATLDQVATTNYHLERVITVPGPTTVYWHTPHFGLNFLLKSSDYSNIHSCVAALENVAQIDK